MTGQRIAIIGGGNLGTAIAEGLLKSGFATPQQITITRRNIARLQQLKDVGVSVTDNNKQAIETSDVIIVALKPYNVKEVLEGLKNSFDAKKHVVISVVTGVFLKDLSAILTHDVPVFRAMPNTAIAIQESVTCLCSVNASNAQVNYVTDLFNQLGISISIDEKLMDAATVLGACGIAYALRFIRAATQGGIEIGFDAKTASLIAAQTVKGAAELLLKGNRHPEEEIDKVTTPKGCTIVGLNEMEHRGFSSSLIRGIGASYNKIGS
ncbi:MAG TPA: pyrroline-5-carboxylate reductase [Cyclobacteriaceae bacterium]|jgi:pyrroline-5-carboxylate reductase|nr:pyrroline-5-carboxylate reductase [Cytophagales bacterium]HMR56474.1 pyrroline-5-carboxylate reductase [Cyclobacteriaceae bacterium]HNT48993.1 pyrroline-5-carboxylate reductase [Cyclobacteriaceae bacterium]HRE68241.1 pyrroline-5-carboxylate reductase [Cyclobacteriaceae bacterium]HRF34315.1 pyrroline-5-carboxylate reductase [Cyclobacteriaceae bacterium]